MIQNIEQLITEMQKEIEKLNYQLSAAETYMNSRLLDRDWISIFPAAAEAKSAYDRLQVLEKTKNILLKTLAKKTESDT